MGRRPRRHRLLGLLAGPILIGSCAPGQCAPVPLPTVAPQWAYLVTLPDGSYVRWDPCDGPITYRIDRTIAPRAADEQAIRDALATAGAATGFTFQEVTAGEEVVIGLQDFSGPGYPPGMLGEGGGDYDRSTGEMLWGIVVVAPGLDPATLRYALLHEIGHMLGLGHVSSTAELMYEYAIAPPKQAYAAGDKEGFRRVGATMPCFPNQRLRAAPPIERIVVA